MLYSLCNRLYPAYYKMNSGSRCNYFIKLPCQTLQVAEASTSRGSLAPSPPAQVQRVAWWTPSGSPSSQKKNNQKPSFCDELIPLLKEVPEWACHVLHKGFFSSTRTEVEEILCWEQWQELHLLVAVTAYAAWSACGHSSVHTETQALSSRKLIWKKMRYEAVAQHILLSNSTGRHFWRKTGQV